MISRLEHPPSAPPELPDLADGDVQRRLLECVRAGWRPASAIENVRRAEGGFSNETWFADVVGGGERESVVLRRQALIGPLEPYDLGREAAILDALRASRVPVPEVYLFCGDADVVGAPFLVMRRVNGVVPEYRDLPEYAPWADPANRSAMAREVIRMLALIQRAPVGTAPFTEVLGAAGDSGAVPPVVGRVRWILEKLELQLGDGLVPPVLRHTAAWLTEHAPPLSDGRVLVHGDYKVGNFIWEGNSIVAVLDWEVAGVGDPLEDLGYACHPLMRARAPELMAMLVPFDELLRIFEEETGRSVDLARLHYYVIYALYFHLYTLFSGLVAAHNGADLRVGLGYSKLHRATRELIAHMAAFEEGAHVL
jgi:aminoglycoside phosphotransferase (APT) family kinase protein